MPSLAVHQISCLVTCNPTVLSKSKSESAPDSKSDSDSDSSDPLGRLYNATVIFHDNTVHYVGPSSEAPISDQCCDIIIDGRGLVALPGLIDCHTHSVWGGTRASEFAERLRGIPYIEILQRGGGILSTVNGTREESKEVLYEKARRRVDRLVQNGTTTVEIKSGYGLNVESEYKMLEVADMISKDIPFPTSKSQSQSDSSVVYSYSDWNSLAASAPRVFKTFLGAHTIPNELRHDRTKYVNQVITEQLPKICNSKLGIDSIDVFVDKGAFTLDEGYRILDAGKRQFGLKVKAHAEQIEHTGVSKLVADMGGLSADHLERLDESGAQAMGEKEVVGVLLPGAQFYLKDTPPPVPLLRKHNVKMAIATDLNPGSSPVYDLLNCATMCCIMQGLSVEESILGVTKYAGLALGNPRLGHISTSDSTSSTTTSTSGSVADLSLFQVPPGEPIEVESLVQYSGGYTCVGSIKDGKIMYNGGGNLKYWKESEAMVDSNNEDSFQKLNQYESRSDVKGTKGGQNITSNL